MKLMLVKITVQGPDLKACSCQEMFHLEASYAMAML
jgi:hypothetical protein